MTSYKIVSFFMDGTSQIEARGFATPEAAGVEAGRIWRDQFNYGRSEHTPTMAHNSGIVSLGVREDSRPCPNCDGEGSYLTLEGYKVTGSGYGDAHEVEALNKCERCDGSGVLWGVTK